MTKPIASLLLLLSCLFLSACEKDWGIDQHGREVTAAQLQGQWLLINYWAEWCGPCRTEIPELNALSETEQGLAVLGVNFDELRAAGASAIFPPGTVVADAAIDLIDQLDARLG